MNLTQSFKIALKSIAAKKGRSVLTMLGIIIGLAAVIILVSFAQGQNKWINDYYASMGDNTVNINAAVWNERDITEELYSYCQTMDEYLLGVTPVSQPNDSVTVKYGSKTFGRNLDWDVRPQVYFGNQQYSLCQNMTLARGRDLTYLDIENLNQVCVLGAKAAETIFNYADPIGETLYLNGSPFTVVGIYADTGMSEYSDKDRTILLPYTLKRLFGGGIDSSFVAKARDANSVTMAITQLKGYLPGLIGEMGYFDVYSPNTWQQDSSEQNRMQELFLAGIAGISLLVGGIGIMNIMLVTVTERTREIGIRKAIGAERKSIIAQFLIEACLICGIGGVIGIAIGYLGTAIVCQLVLGFVVWPSLSVTGGAFLFSVAMGVIFGLYPAVKASGLQPVEALRAD